MPGKYSISCVPKLSVDEFNILENIMQAYLRNKTRARSLFLKISEGYSQKTETANLSSAWWLFLLLVYFGGRVKRLKTGLLCVVLVVWELALLKELTRT